MTVSFSAVFAVDSNCFNICEGLAFTAPLIAAIAAAAISFSFNKCVISRGDGVACRFNDIDACNGTVVACHENTFESHDCNCVMECARPITLEGSAKFELCLNTFVSFGGSPQIKFGGSMSLVQQAKLLVNSNNMHCGGGDACYLPFFFFESMIALSAGAELSLSLNECFDNSGNVNAGALLCALAAGAVVSACPTCPVNLCLNNYYDQILQTQEALGAAVTGALISILEPLSNCAESGYSTLAPSSNSVSGRDVTLAAVAVAAAAALLL